MTNTDILNDILNIENKFVAIKLENDKLKDMLKEVQPILKRAFFGNYKDQNAADLLYTRILEVVGREMS